jgi:hypothetical protein
MRGVGAEERIEVILHAEVGGAEATAEKLVFLVIVAEERAGEFEEPGVFRGGAGGLAESGQFQIDIAVKLVVFSRNGRRG